MMCLTRFTRADLLEDHEKYCNGVNDRPTRIEMPEEGKNTLSFKNHHKQMKVPFVIYADFEALVRKIPGCKRGPESKQKSFTEKTEWHQACGFSYIVVRSDGRATRPVVYRGENAVGKFLSSILRMETNIREILAVPKPIVMTAEDWEKYKNATECHICDKSLIKDQHFDSIPVCDHDTGCYCGQSHKGCYYEALKKMEFIGPKRERKERDKIDQWIAINQETCLFCAEPFIQKNFRDAVKDHCHITGKFRGAAPKRVM